MIVSKAKFHTGKNTSEKSKKIQQTTMREVGKRELYWDAKIPGNSRARPTRRVYFKFLPKGGKRAWPMSLRGGRNIVIIILFVFYELIIT